MTSHMITTGTNDLLALEDLLPRAIQKLLWHALGLGLKVPDQAEAHWQAE